MLKKRIIPKLAVTFMDMREKKVPILVTTKGYSQTKVVGDVLSQAKILEAQSVDEIMLLSIRGAEKNKDLFRETVEKMCSNLASPLAVGGGIRCVSDAGDLIRSGADKIILGSAAQESPQVIEEVSSIYGKQSIIVSVDVKQVEGEFVVVGSERYGIRLIHEWIREIGQRGAGEIMINSVNSDGGKNGLNLELLEEVMNVAEVPIIASCGCGLASHFVEGFKMGASGVAAGTFFFMRDQNPLQCRSQVYNAGIHVRPVL